MTRQTNVLACKPEKLYLALAHVENKLARAWLRKFDGRKTIPIDSIAMLSEHHVSDNDDGYATHFRSIFTDPFGTRDLAVTGAQGLPNIVDCPKRKQDVTDKVSWPAELSMLDQVLRPTKRANITLLITVLTKPSARTRTYYHAMSVHDCRAMQDDDWSYNQPVDGDEKVFMCLVDNDLADGQLAHAAGRLPSKPHEQTVSNLLSPYSSTLAMHSQSDSGRCGKLIVSGFINAEDNKATEQKTEQTAPASSPGLVRHPKMGAKSYTLLSVFE
jgi:hypothetical protein